MILLGLTSFLIVLIPLLLERTEQQECLDFENVRGYAGYEEFPFLFEESTDGKFIFCRRGEPVLEGFLGTNHTPLQEVKVDVYRHASDTILNITRINSNCLRMEWSGLSSREAPIEDCYSLEDAHWYGMYTTKNQTWPINGANIPITPFLPTDYLSTSHVFGGVLHPLWLSSKGSGIHIDNGVELYYKINSTNFCFRAQPYELECVPKASDSIFLNYTVCNFDNIVTTAKYFLNDSGLIDHPSSKPNENLFKYPIWSTWAELKTAINDSSLLNFYNAIDRNHFKISQLEIDDGYSLHYGDLEFTSVSSETLKQLSQSVPLTAWVHPFINYDAEDFNYGLTNDHFLPGFFKDESNSVSLVKWWQGYGAVINFLNSNTSQWHAQRLSSFVADNHLMSLKFDAGESNYLPNCVYIHGLNDDPALFAKAYANFVANQTYANRAEVRVGYYTQGNSILTRLLDRTSVWGTENGLKSVLNAVVSLGLAGYSYILPDMIGGNGIAASDLLSTELPDKELYTRWVQLNTFLPFGQFSIGPWRYKDPNLTAHIQEMMNLHVFLSDQYFIPLAEEVILSSFPLIRPIWWLSASEGYESQIWTIDDQFLIGEHLMVAPMMEQGAHSRSVYFPMGKNWIAGEHGPVAKNATSICNPYCEGGTNVIFHVNEYEVLYFNLTAESLS